MDGQMIATLGGIGTLIIMVFALLWWAVRAKLRPFIKTEFADGLGTRIQSLNTVVDGMSETLLLLKNDFESYQKNENVQRETRSKFYSKEIEDFEKEIQNFKTGLLATQMEQQEQK